MTLPPLRVAAVQAVSTAGDVAANVAAAAGWVRAAAARGAELVVLPELFLSGYSPEIWRSCPDVLDLAPEDARLEPLRGAATDTGMRVLVGAAVRAPDGRHTVSILAFGADGRCVVAYSKQHLWDEERAVFAPGVDGGSVRLGDWPIGLGICYDGCFPEHARAASDAGALVYACPSAYVVGSEHRRDLYYAARAIDNGVYVIFAGLVGRCGELEFSGGTAIYDPQGRPVATVPASRRAPLHTPERLGQATSDPSAPVGGFAPTIPDRSAPVAGFAPAIPVPSAPVGGFAPATPDPSAPVGGFAPATSEFLANGLALTIPEAPLEGLAVATLDREVIAEARRINPYDRDRPATLGARTWTPL